MQFRKIFPLLFSLFVAKGISASYPLTTDSSNGILLNESKSIKQGIDYEKKRIAFHYKTADFHFFNLIDSVSIFISEQEISVERKNNYLRRLHVFLQNIHQSYSDNYFRAGSYSASLNYYPMLIEWDLNDELLRNIKRFSAFTTKAVRLIPNDTIAEDFLFDYLSDYPDDIFRYVEEFDDRNFALTLLEKATKLAPESAKRYYSTTNTVNTILSRSNDVLVKKSYEIFNRYGSKSNAYLLLDAIVSNEITMEAADSISRNPYGMFHLLVEQAVTQGTIYSSYRYMYNYSIDVIRRINNDNPNPAYRQNIFNRYTPEELFVLLCYGYKESTAEVFTQLLKTIQQKTHSCCVNSSVVAGLDKEKLKELVIYCDKNSILPQLLNVVDDEKKNYLLALAAEQKKESPLPVFKSFAKEKSIAHNVPNEKQKSSLPKTNETTAVKEKNLTASAENSLTIISPKADVVPIPLPEPVEPIKIVLDDTIRKVLSMKKNILHTIQNIPLFIKQDNAEQLLSYAAQREPDELFKKVDDFKNNRFSKNILEQCAVNAPVSVKRYLYNSSQPVNYILQRSTDAAVKKIFEINAQIGYRNKPLLLLDDILKRKLSVTDAIEISSDQDKLFSTLVKIISRNEYIGRYSIDHEMRDYSLRFIREINDKIATGEAQPFSPAENFKSAELYFLMLYGRDEVFTSTFNGLFNRFIQKLPENNGSAFLHSISHNQFRDFLSLCSNFGKMEEFLSKFSSDEKQKILISYTSNLETEQDDLSTIVLVAEAISNLKDNQLLSLLQTNIKKEYERVKNANDQIGISIYGVLSSMISGSAKVETFWYKTVAEQFKVSPVGLLTSSSLFNQKNSCVQQMYFYNDDDGRSSFINFMNTYKNYSAWGIEDRRSYVRIYSREGMHIELFANKPEFEETGIEAINEYLKENKLSPSVVIHRGHSYHTEATLEKVSASAKLVFVGSCGGFYKVSIALENAPDAHIISTKQVGTKTINDAMLLALNENIRAGKDIIWNDFWDKMRMKLGGNQYFSDYIPPNKNLEAVFIRAYYKLLGV